MRVNPSGRRERQDDERREDPSFAREPKPSLSPLSAGAPPAFCAFLVKEFVVHFQRPMKHIEFLISAASQKNPKCAFHILLSLCDVHQRAPLLQPPRIPSARSRRRKARGIRPIWYTGLSRRR